MTVDISSRQGARERVVFQSKSRTSRWIGAVALLGAACWLVVILARRHQHLGWHYSGVDSDGR